MTAQDFSARARRRSSSLLLVTLCTVPTAGEDECGFRPFVKFPEEIPLEVVDC